MTDEDAYTKPWARFLVEPAETVSLVMSQTCSAESGTRPNRWPHQGRMINTAWSLDYRRQVSAAGDQLAGEALRVLAVARRHLGTDHPDQDLAEHGLTLLGLVAMMAPPRPDVTGAVAACRKAGIRIVMVTGRNRREPVLQLPHGPERGPEHPHHRRVHQPQAAPGRAFGIALVSCISYIPALQSVFGTAGLTAWDWLMLTGFGLALLLADEGRKAVVRHRRAQ
jgi:hypothetical protein